MVTFSLYFVGDKSGHFLPLQLGRGAFLLHPATGTEQGPGFLLAVYLVGWSRAQVLKRSF